VSGPAVVTLDTIAASVDYGVTASASWDGAGPKFLRITDIQDGQVDWRQVPWCECNERERASAQLEVGDIVFARTGATTGKSFLIRECPESAVFASYLIRVRLRDTASPAFVSHYFQSQEYWSQITSNVRGVAQPGVNATTLKSLRIPLPPLPEQRRVAAILDQADTLRTQRRAALAQLDSLTQSLFIDMFGDPVSCKLVWPNVRLGDLVADVQIGPFGSLLHQEDYVEGGVPLINPMHIKFGRLEPDSSQSITTSKHTQLSLYHLRAGDVVMGRRGEMGRCAVVSEEHDGILCGTGSLFVRPNQSRATSQYLFAVLSHSSMKSHLESVSLGATMPNLNKSIVAGLQINVPPLPLQQTFATRVQAIEGLKAKHRAALAEADALFAALQQRAFGGSL
jgi:type I restriction enzyme, S subunit